MSISPRLHAWSDLALLLFGLVAPFIFGYADSGVPAYYTFAAVAGGVVLDVLTDYPLGVVKKLIPMKIHRWVEMTGPGIFIAGPWYLFPGTPAAWVLTVIGVLNFLTSALTRI